MTHTLAQRLLIRPGDRALVLNPPDGLLQRLTPMAEGAQFVTASEGVHDVVLAFVASRAEIARVAPTALTALRPGGMLWFCYPKKSAGIRTDVDRDHGWDSVV